MICSICGKPANRYTVKNAKGECEVVLCDVCYKRLYNPDPSVDEEENIIPQKECPACGTTYDDFKRTGLVGCAECYSTFREELLPLLGYLQQGVVHTGSAPVERDEQEYDKLRALIAEQERLRGALDEAVAAGDLPRKKRIFARLEKIQNEIHREDED